MRRALLLLAAAACAACGALPFPAYERCDDAARRAELARGFPRAPDTAARVSLRVVIERGAIQHALTFHGLAFPSGSLYLQSINDWGGRGCALVRDGQAARGLATPAGAPAALWESLVTALAAALAPPPAADAALARLQAGGFALAARRGAEEVLIAPCGDGDGVRYDVGKDGRWSSSVRAAGWIRGNDGRPVCPGRIDIDGLDAGYLAHAEVVLWEPSDADEREIRRELEQSFGAW